MNLRKNLLWLFVTVFLALVQSTLPDWLKVQGVTPDLVLLVVVYFALLDGEERAMLTGTIGGMFQDVASETVVGHHIICLVIVGYVVGRLATRLITDHPAVRVGLVFLAGLLHGAIFTAVAYVQRPDLSALYTIGVAVVPAAFYTALFTPLVYFFLTRLFRRQDRLAGVLS
jgi:rod shape-determining protein MreD